MKEVDWMSVEVLSAMKETLIYLLQDATVDRVVNAA